jgi:hypothetical protein
MTTMTGGTPDYDLLAPISTDAEVLGRVDQLIGTDARRDRSLWLFFLTADAVQLPAVVPVDDMPISPDPDTAGSICHMIAHVLRDAAPGGSAVITLVRDNGLSVTGPDEQWLMALRSAAARTGMHLRMLCLATREGTRQLDLPAGASLIAADAAAAGTPGGAT